MRRLSAAFFVLALAAAPVAMAAGSSGTKVGLIDFQHVMTRSSAGQDVLQQLQAFGKQLQAKMEPEQNKLKKEQEDLKKNSKIETKAQQAKAQQQFQSQVQAYQQKAQQARESFQKKRASLMVPLQGKLYDVVAAYAKKHGYDLILDSHTAVYNKSDLDLTDAILKAFNKAQPHAPAPDTSATPAELGGGPGGQ